MEPTKAKMRVFLGEFPVEEVLAYGAFRVRLGTAASITVHLGDFPHSVKPGDMIPLYTEIPYDKAVATSVQ